MLRSTDFYLWVFRAQFSPFGRRAGVQTPWASLLNVHLLLSNISRINTILLNNIRGYLVGLSPSKEKCFICFNESPLKMAKNVFFYFILKVPLVQRYFNFFMTVCSYRKNGLISEKHNLVNKQLQYRYCPISHEVKTIKQWNLVS